VEIDAASMLPPDAQAYGFDTNADALAIEPALLDRYLTAAAKIARLAIGDPSLRPSIERYTAVKGNSNEQTWLWQTARLARRDRRPTLLPGGWRICLSGSTGKNVRRADPWPERAERDRDPRGWYAARAVCDRRRP
jgi:hypothetical protein